jgi:hypothetical protein
VDGEPPRQGVDPKQSHHVFVADDELQAPAAVLHRVEPAHQNVGTGRVEEGSIPTPVDAGELSNKDRASCGPLSETFLLRPRATP